MSQYKGPNGEHILGTLEALSAVAIISGVKEDGTIEYEGSTDIFWDDQKTVIKDGERVFVDPNGNLFLESQLTITEDEGSDIK